MILFATRRVGGQRRDRRGDKLVQQHPTGSGPGVIPDNENNHQSEETADDLPQRAIEELAELELHRVAKQQAEIQTLRNQLRDILGAALSGKEVN